MHAFKAQLLAVALVACTSCGTMASRSQNEVGAYPLMAVWADLSFLAMGVGAERGVEAEGIPRVLLLLGGLISLPIDLVFDAVVLPLDLGAWAFGIYKFPSVGPQ